MKIGPGYFSPYFVSIISVLIFVILRWAAGGFDFSHFIAAGTDFVDSTKTPSSILVQPGQGYDGQFFYRLALDPFDFSNHKHGVTFDYAAYRSQRIVYPLLAWLFSFGGIPVMVPLALVLVNILTFTGMIFLIQKITNHFNANSLLAFCPLFLFGAYMSIAKDLSEVTELFFFTAAVWFMINSSWILFAVCVILTMLTRETSLIAFVPLSVWLFFNISKNRITRFVLLIIPFVIIFLWKYFISINTHSSNFFEGAGNITWPFAGVYPGFIANFDFSNTKNSMQFIFWVAYFVWQIWMICEVISTLNDKGNQSTILYSPMMVVYVSWLLFALCLSSSVYNDDWSFVRVFSLWNLIGFLVLIAKNKLPGKGFFLFSMILLVFTIIRLIIRP